MYMFTTCSHPSLPSLCTKSRSQKKILPGVFVIQIKSALLAVTRVILGVKSISGSCKQLALNESMPKITIANLNLHDWGVLELINCYF